MNHNRIIIERLDDTDYNSVLLFIHDVFHGEQNIPEALIPIINHEQKWWGVRTGEAILGTAAIWKEVDAWHWGRFAVDKSLRGLGIGKSLAITSFKDAFNSGIHTLHIDARDTTVGIIEKFGGIETAEKIDFHGTPVTPMVLYKELFLNTLNKI